MESDEIIKKLVELSKEKLEQDTLIELGKMSYEELLGVFIQTRYLEREVLLGSRELMAQLNELEKTLGYCEEMEEYLRITFVKNFEIDTEDININFIEGDDDSDGNS